ncbi:MAG: Ig-like domain-containing protein, partial [Acidobacteriota bacterium]
MKPSKRDLIVVKLCLVVLLLALAGASGFRTGASPAPGRHSNNFDTEPPTVSITGLADGATVSGAFWLRATARDETGVAGVRFTLDGADLGPEDTTEPFAMLVDGRALSVGPHLLTATARDVTGNATTTAVTEIRIRQPVDSHLLNTLEPGEWLEIPDSDMRQVAPVDPPGDVECVITCWSGAAYDSLENRMIVWGGGHGQYGGNELYAFDLDLLQWTRLTEPSIIDQDDTAETYADGRPRSVHTYDMLQFDESTNSFCSFGL